MANEAVCLQTPTRFRRYTVADGAGIAKGTILKLTTPMTAAASTADNDIMCGIAWEEKTASDGITEIVAALDGVWSILTTNAAITVGQDVTAGGTNEIKVFTTLDDEAGKVLGKALETCSANVRIAVAVDVS